MSVQFGNISFASTSNKIWPTLKTRKTFNLGTNFFHHHILWQTQHSGTEVYGTDLSLEDGGSDDTKGNYEPGSASDYFVFDPFVDHR